MRVDVIYCWLRVKIYSLLETLLQGIAAVFTLVWAREPKIYNLQTHGACTPRHMKCWYIVKYRNPAKDIEISKSMKTARSGSWSMIGLTAEGPNQINVKEKVLKLSGPCLCPSWSHVWQITNLLICSPLLQGNADVVARWCGDGTDNILFTSASFVIFKVYDLHLT